MIKKCRACAECRAIYCRGAAAYYKCTDLLYCSKFDEIIEKDGVCDNRRKNGRKYVDLSPSRFDEVERDILFIKKNVNKLK